MSLMELVAQIAGEPIDENPSCTSPVLADWCNLANDDLPEETRQKLIPLAPELSRSRATEGEAAKADTLFLHVLRETLCPALHDNRLEHAAQELEETMETIRLQDLGNLPLEFRERAVTLTTLSEQDEEKAGPAGGMMREARVMAVSAWQEEPPDIYEAICSAHNIVCRAIPDPEERLLAHTNLIRKVMQAN